MIHHPTLYYCDVYYVDTTKHTKVTFICFINIYNHEQFCVLFVFFRNNNILSLSCSDFYKPYQIVAHTLSLFTPKGQNANVHTFYNYLIWLVFLPNIFFFLIYKYLQFYFILDKKMYLHITLIISILLILLVIMASYQIKILWINMM